MCLIINRPPNMKGQDFIKSIVKVAKENMATYKIVICEKLPWYKRFFHNHNRFIPSYYQGYLYALGKETDFTPLGIRYLLAGRQYFLSAEYIGSAEKIEYAQVTEGYHSYSMGNTYMKVHEDCNLTVLGKEKNYQCDNYLLSAYYAKKGYVLAIMHCIIPKGTKYSTNDKGECVSESILPTKITIVTEDNLKALKKEGFNITFLS